MHQYTWQPHPTTDETQTEAQTTSTLLAQAADPGTYPLIEEEAEEELQDK